MQILKIYKKLGVSRCTLLSLEETHPTSVRVIELLLQYFLSGERTALEGISFIISISGLVTSSMNLKAEHILTITVWEAVSVVK
jgi:hypothetical protein